MSRRGGRNRKPGRREPGGRLQRKSQAAEARQVVIDYRQNQYGLSQDDAAQPRAETVFGRLALGGSLHPDQFTNDILYEAGILFRRTREAAHRALQSQQMRSGGDLEWMPPGYDSDCGSSPDYVRECAAARQMDERLRACVFDRAGSAALTALVSVVCENAEPRDMAALRSGLHALVAENVLRVAS